MPARRRTTRSLLRRALPLVVAAPLLVVVPGAPAWACSCVAQDLQQSRERADVVLSGEVLGRQAPSSPRSSIEQVTYVVRVDRVYKGRAAAVQEVLTVVDGATCGLELPASGPVLLFAGTGPVPFLDLVPGPGQLTATLCSGSRTGTSVPAAFGLGQPPVSSDALPGPQAQPAARDTSGLPVLGLAGAAALVAAVAGGVLVLRRRRPADLRR